MSNIQQQVPEDVELVFERGQNGNVLQHADGHTQEFDPETWGLWRKTALTRAVRLPRPFTVQTSEGPLRCDDGYLAVDARGYPYPIAYDEFVKIYESVGAEGGGELHPATAAILRYFEYEHLPPHLQEVSRPFCELARKIAAKYEGAEATTGLRKLLEAKDCVVRAALP